MVVDRRFRRLLPDIFGNWWTFFSFDSLWSVRCSSGVKTWRLPFEPWAASWKTPFALFCVSSRWFWLSLFGFLFPKRQYVCYIGSKKVFLCGMNRFATGLTGCADSFWFSFNSVVCFLLLLLLALVLLLELKFVWSLFLLPELLLLPSVCSFSLLSWRHWFR